MADAGVGEAAAAEGAKTAGEVAAAEGAGAAAAGTAAEGAGAAAAGSAAGGAATGIGSTAGMLTAADAAAAGTALSDTALSESILAGTGAASASTPVLGAAGAAAGADALGAGIAEGVPFLPGVAENVTAESALGSFLPVSGQVTPLSAELAASLGLSSDLTAATSALPASTFPVGVDAVGSGATDFSLGDMASNFGSWIEKNPAQAALLGFSGINALSTPKLPPAANTALSNASAMTQQAQQTIASGGTSSPAWPQQKASIDQQINQYVKNTEAHIKQSAVNSGMGGADSMVVRQQLNNLQQQAETQRQAMYQQALSQIVSQSVAELTGGNQTLSSIAHMELGQSQEARQSAAQTAQLAIMLGQMSKTPSTGGGT